MGNICSKSKNEADAFAQPGRVLGSSSTPQTPGQPRASVPAKTNWGSSGRTLGDSAQDGDAKNARSKAAEAAQKRAESNTTGKGKLGSKLAAQKAQTHTQTLNEASQTERAARDADDAAQARRWD